MARTSFADLLAAAHQMAAAMQTNPEQLATRGGSEEFTQRGAALVTQLREADHNQERLKAELKAATTQVEGLRTELSAWLGEAESTVKLTYRGQKEKWIEFGIKAKR